LLKSGSSFTIARLTRRAIGKLASMAPPDKQGAGNLALRVTTKALLGLMRGMVRLPIDIQFRVMRAGGRLAKRFAKRRAEIGRVNLALCFPELDDTSRERLLEQHFESAAAGVAETMLGWWSSTDRLMGRSEIRGIQHLLDAVAKGRGVILLSAHFTTLEIGGRLLAESAPDLPLKAMYRPNENSTLEQVIRQQRQARFGEPIKRDDVRGVIRALRRGEIVWYASDQNYGHRYSVFAPFFGIPAATNTATSRLAGLTGAAVVPFFTRRLENDRYLQVFEPALADFPSDDALADATRINKLIEGWVRQAPDQYFWLHRRFKDRPEGESPVYPEGN
jgi:KDO2-lipid IV(A) lauroyltransferase